MWQRTTVNMHLSTIRWQKLGDGHGDLEPLRWHHRHGLQPCRAGGVHEGGVAPSYLQPHQNITSVFTLQRSPHTLCSLQPLGECNPAHPRSSPLCSVPSNALWLDLYHNVLCSNPQPVVCVCGFYRRTLAVSRLVQSTGLTAALTVRLTSKKQMYKQEKKLEYSVAINPASIWIKL